MLVARWNFGRFNRPQREEEEEEERRWRCGGTRNSALSCQRLVHRRHASQEVRTPAHSTGHEPPVFFAWCKRAHNRAMHEGRRVQRDRRGCKLVRGRRCTADPAAKPETKLGRLSACLSKIEGSHRGTIEHRLVASERSEEKNAGWPFTDATCIASALLLTTF
ncbi:hypothetical protein KM043_009096 [Ampulex compressa]|nr:hypothetical protein KM043_009096 [Ampulex compressa]